MSVEAAQKQFLGDLTTTIAWINQYGCVLPAPERDRVLAYEEKWKKINLDKIKDEESRIKPLCSATPDHLPMELQPNGLAEYCVSDAVRGVDDHYEGVPYRCRRSGKVRFYVRRTVFKYAPPGQLLNAAGSPEQRVDLGTERDGKTFVFHIPKRGVVE